MPLLQDWYKYHTSFDYLKMHIFCRAGEKTYPANQSLVSVDFQMHLLPCCIYTMYYYLFLSPILHNRCQYTYLLYRKIFYNNLGMLSAYYSISPDIFLSNGSVCSIILEISSYINPFCVIRLFNPLIFSITCA